MKPQAWSVARCHRNLAILSVGMLCNMSSYQTLEAMQSSLNKGVGVSSLAVVYGTALTSGILLPPYLIMKLKCRKCLYLSPIAYAIYTAANFYPAVYTLLPASFVLGFGASALWPAASVYIIDLSTRHASLIKQDALAITGRYFGIFGGIASISELFGMVFLAILFNTLKNDTNVNPVRGDFNSSFEDQFIGTTVGVDNNVHDRSPSNVTSCGLYHDINDKPSNPNATLSDVVLYTMYTGFLALNILTSIMYFFLDDVEDATPKIATKTSVQNLSSDCVSLTSDQERNEADKERSPSKKSIEVENIDLIDKEDLHDEDEGYQYKSKQTGPVPLNKQSSLSTIRAVTYLLISNKCGLLLAILSIAVGMTQALVRGTFLASWVTCTDGINYTVYVMLCFGVFISVGSMCSGFLLKLITFVPLFAIALFFHVSVLMSLLFLRTEHDLSMTYFILAMFMALAKGTFNAQLPNVYNTVFPSQKSAAVTLNAVSLNGGTAILYLVSVFVLPVVSVTTLLTTILTGFITFVIAFKIKDSKYKKWSCTNTDSRDLNANAQ